MTKLKLRNDLDGKVRVLEGNVGVYSTKFILGAHKSVHLDLDPNATYREYVLIVLPDDTRLEPFSSDDVLDYEEIVIMKDNGKVVWEGKHRGVKDTPHKPTKPPPVTSELNPGTSQGDIRSTGICTGDTESKVSTGTPAAGQSSSGFMGKFKNLFGFK